MRKKGECNPKTEYIRFEKNKDGYSFIIMILKCSNHRFYSFVSSLIVGLSLSHEQKCITKIEL